MKNDPTYKKICGQKQIITLMQICEIEKILENKGLEDHGLTCSQLGFKVSVNASKTPIKRVMSSLDYHKGFVYQRD